MKIIRLLSFMIILMWTSSIQSQDVVVYETFEEFEHELNKKDNKVHVVNFWATWCAPCVKELPYFDELNAKYAGKEVEIVLVSLDFRNQLDSRLKPFLNKKQYDSRVVMLGDPKANNWIDKVDTDWSGTIPATVVYKNDKSIFLEQEFHSMTEIEEIILPFLK